MKKALMVASVASMIDQFNMPNIELLKEDGYEVHIACNFIDGNTCSLEKIELLKEKLESQGVFYHQIDFARNVFNISSNIKAYKQIKRILIDNKFDLIHCHSPIGGVIGRLAARSYRKTGTKVIYTAHGFHFYEGAPLKNWLIYYPVEKVFSYLTDILITINHEDYALAQKRMKAKEVVYVPGIGIDLNKFTNSLLDKDIKRNELGIPKNSKWILNIGELIPRKNQETLIRAIAEIKDAYLTVAGRGDLMESLEELINELKISDRVKLLGFRTDISELCNSCDIFAFSSFHEGLPVSVMEAMACGLPVVCSQIRGNTDLINENGGMLFDPHSVDDCKNAIKKLINADLTLLGNYNAERIKDFSLDKVNVMMKELYSN